VVNVDALFSLIIQKLDELFEEMLFATCYRNQNTIIRANNQTDSGHKNE
jgi:hypothetical protein